jgi:dipeptidyl aminopeptidase/acylaminoacyl peptidase
MVRRLRLGGRFLGRLWTECHAGAFVMTALAILSASGAEKRPITTDHKMNRPVTVADAILMTHAIDDSYAYLGPPRGRVAHFSPDGAKFVVVLRKGNLEGNTNEYSVVLWRTPRIFSSPLSETLLTLSSSSNREAISDISWLDDSETIVFLGERPNELRQMFAFNIRTRRLKKLTSHPSNVLGYSMSANGHLIAFTAERPPRNFFDGKSERDGFVVSTDYLIELLADKRRETACCVIQSELFLQRIGEAARAITLRDRISNDFRTPYISPNGHFILVRTEVEKIPEEWREYTEATLAEYVRRGSVERYSIIDAATGQERPLLDAPISPSGSQVAWSPDSLSVAIAGVNLPLDKPNGSDRDRRKSTSFIVEVRVDSGNVVEIGTDDLKLLSWEKKGSNRLIFGPGRSYLKAEAPPQIVFEEKEGKWGRLGDSIPNSRLPTIVVEEDMNSPPKIVAIDPTSTRKVLLLDLNPQFKDLQFAKVEEIHWKGMAGQEVKGGLYYPVGYIRGHKYPLVVQTHGWNPNKFWIDGPSSTAFAAQPLAGKGIVVLQSDEQYGYGDPKETERDEASLEGAIDYLDAQQLIDRSRVGIIGWSRSCLVVKYALSHPTYRLAAASITDGIDAGYFQYIATAQLPGPTNFYERINGGTPFGDGLKTWLERSPSFNIDKVETPLLITAENSSALLYEWEWFAALRRLGKPVEMVVMQDGSHELQKPWERVISLQANVDWFSFWLKGEEDPDPAKKEQYGRWRGLKKMQEENDAKAKAAAAAN